MVVGVLPPGTLNAITDVDGVKVGHTTLIRGETVRTGVTAVLPHGATRLAVKQLRIGDATVDIAVDGGSLAVTGLPRGIAIVRGGG